MSDVSFNEQLRLRLRRLSEMGARWLEDPTGDPDRVEPLAKGVMILSLAATHLVDSTNHHVTQCQCERCQQCEWLGRAMEDLLK